MSEPTGVAGEKQDEAKEHVAETAPIADATSPEVPAPAPSAEAAIAEPPVLVEAPGPEVPAPEPAKPEVPAPEPTKPEVPAPEPKPEVPAPEPAKPEVPATEPKPEVPAPEPPKPEVPTAEAPKPEEPAPEAAELEKPAEDAKPEEPAPEAAELEKPAEDAAKPEVPATEAKPEEPAPEPPKPEVPAPPPPPSITTVAPDHGPLDGGTTVVVTGEGFVEGCLVIVGGVEAKAAWKDATTLEATTPAGAKKGLAEMRVVNPDGQVALYGEDYRYDPAPSIAGTEPSFLSTEGGAVLTILGADFVQGCAVRIGDALVPSSWAHAGRLEAVCKRHAPGDVDVVVENPDKQRAVRERAVRYATPPHLDSIDPASTVTVGGAEVTLHGSGFDPGSTVLVAGAPVDGTTFVSEIELRFAAPVHHAAELVDIAIVNPSGLLHRRPLAFAYTTAPPRIAAVTPDRGTNAGGTELVVHGQDFDERAAAFVCGIAVKVTFRSHEELLVVTPAVARDGLVDVRVVNPDDQAHTAEKAFRYLASLPPPELRQVSPRTGSQLGGLKVAILGESFAEGVEVRFGGVLAAASFLTGKELSAITPVFVGQGEVAVEVRNPDGASSLLEDAFTYEPRPAPEISGITPTSGPTTGGTRVIVEGKNFTREAAVFVGREHPKDLVFKSATELHIVTAPRKQAGVVDLEVSVPGAPKAVMKNGFRFDAVPAPIITGVSPTAGAVGGGTEMTVSGKHFTKETVVLVDGKPPRAVKLIDASTLELKTPPGEPGKLADVVVRNPDGKEAVQKRAFLYDPRYRG